MTDGRDCAQRVTTGWMCLLSLSQYGNEHVRIIVQRINESLTEVFVKLKQCATISDKCLWQTRFHTSGKRCGITKGVLLSCRTYSAD